MDLEYLNYVIGRSIAYRQNAEELLTNETSRQWVSDLPTIIKAYNEFVKESKNATVSEEQINDELEQPKQYNVRAQVVNYLMWEPVFV